MGRLPGVAYLLGRLLTRPDLWGRLPSKLDAVVLPRPRIKKEILLSPDWAPIPVSGKDVCADQISFFRYLCHRSVTDNLKQFARFV